MFSDVGQPFKVVSIIHHLARCQDHTSQVREASFLVASQRGVTQTFDNREIFSIGVNDRILPNRQIEPVVPVWLCGCVLDNWNPSEDLVLR